MKKAEIGNEYLTLGVISDWVREDHELILSQEVKQQVERCHQYLKDKLANSDQLFYGVNTGFGALCNVAISGDQIEELQVNLVRSHACGTGESVPASLVQLMLLFKVLNLSKGYSGISRAVLDRLLVFYNRRLFPVIYKSGSLGASGDLAPLAHLSLPLFGEGEIWYEGKKCRASDVLPGLGLEALTLGPKEGLALLNGTQFMSAYAFHAWQKSTQLMDWANFITALSMDAFDAKSESLDPLIHSLRQAHSQGYVADTIRFYLEGSEISGREKKQVQDPYSFRCVPQVHAAVHSAFDHVGDVLEQEINGVSDNPNIFVEEDRILSGGNFHGEPLALILDYAAIAISEIGSISERRTYQLISGQRGLPAFLTAQGGLHSGMMIPQYTAASLVSKNKQLCTPASVDSIPSSNGQEDHVSMGANAAVKLYDVVENVHDILAIELMCAAHAIEYRRPARSSQMIENMLACLREELPFNDKDHVLYEDMRICRAFIMKNNPLDFA